MIIHADILVQDRWSIRRHFDGSPVSLGLDGSVMHITDCTPEPHDDKETLDVFDHLKDAVIETTGISDISTDRLLQELHRRSLG